MERLLYDLEYQVNELRKTKLNTIKHNNMTVQQLLDLGFDNSFIIISDKWFNLGYRWQDKKVYGYGSKYGSNDFGELNEDQLNCMVKYVADEISDYNYQQVSVELVNEKDSKYFLEG